MSYNQQTPPRSTNDLPETIIPIPSCDLSDCPLLGMNCPECSPVEEFIDGLRVVVSAPDPCEDCQLHALLHAEAFVRHEMKKLRTKDLLREVEEKLGVHPVTFPIPGHWYDEDRNC